MIESFHDWVKYGIEHGWCSAPLCMTHDGVGLDEEQEAEMDEGLDPCVSVLRIYVDSEERDKIEARHSPSQWRKHGWV